MKTHFPFLKLSPVNSFFLGILAAVLQMSANARAECAPLVSGLHGPTGLIQTNQGNLLVAENGTPSPNTGRISIVGLNGTRRTLIGGLPSGIYFETNQASGPNRLLLRGRTLYVTIGVGDAVLAGPAPGLYVPNPNPSSPLLSSILAIHFSADVEQSTTGFNLTLAQQHALAAGQPVTLRNGQGQSIGMELVVNFPNYVHDPRPDFPANVRQSNPFGLIALDDRLYVTDGGRNLVFRVNLADNGFSILSTFRPIPNPLFPGLGGPSLDAVPTGISYANGQLLVTLFRGFPFPPNTSTIVKVDPQTGARSALIGDLKTAIDVLPVTLNSVRNDENPSYLVLEFASGPVLSPPGLLLQFARSSTAPTVLADCLTAPTSMALDDRTGKLYIAELTGQIVSVAVDVEHRGNFCFF